MSVKSVLHRLANEMNRPALHEEIERDDDTDNEYDDNGQRITRDKDGNMVTGVQHYDYKGQPVGGRYDADGQPVTGSDEYDDKGNRVTRDKDGKVVKEDKETTDGNA
jgi:hypothetical protein